MNAPYLVKIVCLECGHEMAAAQVMAAACPECQSQWLDARYDYDTIRSLLPDVLEHRAHTLWRYAELLPVQPTVPEITMGEGWTPLSRLYAYETLYDQRMIFVKDERAQPTNSFKDRQAVLSVMAMKQHGIKECVLASTGNAAVAYAAYCARAGIKLWLFLTALVPSEKMREAAIYGCEVVRVSGTYDETKKVAAEFARRRGIHLDRGAKAVPGKESMKTLAFEIAEQLGLALHPENPGRWQAPDWYIQGVSGGIGPLGVWKGFSELLQLGLIDKMPKLGIVQAAGCSPMVRAFQANQPTADPVVPQTLITVLATGDPGYSYVQLREAVLSNGGSMVAVTDGETFDAMRRIASRGGMSVEPATAVAFAGLETMLREGTITQDEIVVVNCSGHTFPAESHILGDQYRSYILNLDVEPAADDSVPLHESLSGALKNLDEQVTTIVIVDDNANDRRLYHRLLQRYKRYRIYEARNGIEALTVIKERQPDLVITDLKMPEMDGFMLLEQLKKTPGMADIPVIVVSAKTLSPEDKAWLDAMSETVLQKGSMDTRQLVRHVVATLEHEPVEILQPVHSDTVDADAVESEPVYTIVVVDDNPLDLRLARRILDSGGNFQVIEAENGREGIKAIYHHHPDLIILDLMLPDMTGFTLIEALLGDDNLRDIPVIIYSARDLTPDERRQLQDNIRRVIHKTGLDRRSFLQVIRDTLP